MPEQIHLPARSQAELSKTKQSNVQRGKSEKDASQGEVEQDTKTEEQNQGRALTQKPSTRTAMISTV
jgi:hypothetical protein